MSQESVAIEYVDAAIASLRRYDLLRQPDPNMPTEMRDTNGSKMDDWVPWQPIASTVTDGDISELQSRFRAPLPAPYVAFLKHRHFYELDGCGVRFEDHVVGRWKKRLIDLYDTYRLRFPNGSHLIPFGRETFMDAGPACFDFQKRRSNGDCPVVFWDHEWVSTDREVRLLFSSSERMFRCLAFAARSDIDFVYSDPNEDSEEELAKKGRLLAQFLELDPEGAGGPGREYWTSWGVTLS